MTCLLSKYPVKYVKKILQKLQKFIIYCRQLLPNAWQCRKPATGSSLRTHSDKKTAIIILFIMMLLHIQFYHILFICFGELIIILFPDAFLCISMIFYSLSYMFIQIYYSCFFTHFNNIFKYMVLCSICLQFLFLLSGFIFSVYSYYYLNLLYRPFYLLL